MATSNQQLVVTKHPALLEAKHYLCAHFGERLVCLVLFGSFARGQAVDGSDYDLMVVLKGALGLGQEIEATSLELSQICLKYNVLIACLFVEEARFLKEKSPLMFNVRREGIVL